MKNPWKQYSKINPQREDGNRQIANEVFNALMSAELSGSEFRIVMAVINKTWGFGKESDCIAISQFEEMTGLAERTVKESIKILKTKRVLFYAPSNIRVRCGSPINEFIFNKHYDTWKTQGCKKVHACTKTSNKGEQNCKIRVSNSSPTKETITKETITKERATLPAGLSEDTFSEYLEMRKKIKKPLLEKSFNRFFKSLSTICQQNKASPEDILNQSILNSWQGIFPLKQEFKQNANSAGFNKNTRYISQRDAINAAAADEADIINRERAERLRRQAENSAAGDS